MNANESPHGVQDEIFLQPNFEKHTNLYLDFYKIQIANCLKKHGLTLERFEAVINASENQSIFESYNAQCHFPFIGLVRERAQSSFDGAATLARPPPLQINLSKHSP